MKLHMLRDMYYKHNCDSKYVTKTKNTTFHKRKKAIINQSMCGQKKRKRTSYSCNIKPRLSVVDIKLFPDSVLVMASPTSKAAVVIGQAEESEEDDDTVDPKLQKGEETKSLPQVAQTRMGDARAGLAGLRLSSVTATVERRLGSLPSIELPLWTSTGASSSKKSPPGKEEELQHPSLLHKRLYERNQEVHADLHIFFQVGILSEK